jgi:hypothetical protein
MADQQLHSDIESLARAYVLGDLSEGSDEYTQFESLLEAQDPVLMQSLEALFKRSVALGAAVRYGEEESDIPNPLAGKVRSKNRQLIVISLVAGLLICLLLAMNVSKSAKLDRSNDLMKGLMSKVDSLSRIQKTVP